MMLNNRSDGDASWKEASPKKGYQYRHTTYDHLVPDELLQSGLVDSSISCGEWLFECGNIVIDVNTVKTILKIGFYGRHWTVKFATPLNKEASPFFPSIGICFQRT
jgi:hypothetical protein